ncbi:Exodeoxyribonuclease VII large subunit [Marinospirillum alkaliphilum DSM 21637]|uniref:Exodeoxyribonuclease 7 large subunit n=1 Tax=Marinospirillum alkaliphilum DSM 21637 TaxID=1122209 RepID=A0A1K1WT00_9GAMM|nr:Exodeoxyribonuclease VII large subunit [Marinospirillum alkaliphilum DSM 21637]
MHAPLVSGTPSGLVASLTVSQLNARARQLLEQGLAQVWVEGEVSNFMASAAGHWYFSLKDERAQVSCVMFAGRNQLLVRQPRNGDRLLLCGTVSLYEGRGQYQLLAEQLRFSGEGDLLARLEALKQKLAAEGLFASERKRPLPPLVQRIGVITSLQGAALRDVLQVLKRRWPLAEVLVYPALVQGQEAPASLRRAMALAQYHGQPQVLLLARGGGSLEDLQAFNDETLARMVAASAMPVVTGVGHETDFTLVDFVADLRAPTPSAAAEAVSPDRQHLQQQLDVQQGRLIQAFFSRLRGAQQHLDSLSLRAASPNRLLKQQQQRLQQLVLRLQAQQPCRRLALMGQQWQRLNERLGAASPRREILRQQQRLQQWQKSLQQGLASHQRLDRERLQSLAARLHAISPLNTLNRGYALASSETGEVLRSSKQIKPGDPVKVRLAEGSLDCRVEKVRIES